MEPADFAVRMEEVLNEECSEYVCLLVDEDDIARLWNFVIEDSINGFIAYEDNEDTIGVPTITVGINLGDVTEAGREELADLLDKNGDLVNATLCLINVPVEKDEIDVEEELELDMEPEEPDTRDLLFIQTKVPYEAFEPEDFPGYIGNLMFQTETFIDGTADEEED
jgi:hypothetical protein